MMMEWIPTVLSSPDRTLCTNPSYHPLLMVQQVLELSGRESLMLHPQFLHPVPLDDLPAPLDVPFNLLWILAPKNELWGALLDLMSEIVSKSMNGQRDREYVLFLILASRQCCLSPSSPTP